MALFTYDNEIHSKLTWTTYSGHRVFGRCAHFNIELHFLRIWDTLYTKVPMGNLYLWQVK